jgi:hypothetical protein
MLQGPSLRERWQLHEVSRGYWLQGLTRLLPGRHPSYEDERIESLFSQLQRHPGAGRFACSSTVNVYVFILGKSIEFLG